MLQGKLYQPVENIPREISQLMGPCGPASVWLVLSRHGIAADPHEVIDRCRYTDEFGCFTVCMAEALQHFGLSVRLHTDQDPSPGDLERISYALVSSANAESVSRLLGRVRANYSVIVSYLAPGGDGHFSPLAGCRANKLLLPYSIGGEMLRSEFNVRRRAPGILRQTIVAT
ncbi:hypothetical protein GCM10027159_01830 [Lysobacter terrae]